MPDPTSPRPSAIQWCMGLFLLGWGVSVLVGIIPHEDMLVGAGLVALGAALLIAIRKVPALPRIPSPLLAGLGAILVLGAGAFLLTGFAPPKLALVSLGAFLLTASATQGRSLRILGRSFPVSTLATSALPFACGPAAVYAAQALFRQGTGTTPLDAFLAAGLVAPVAFIVSLFGWSPQQEGRFLSFASPDGPVRMEVGVACSGIQAMALFAGLLAVLVAVERPKPRLAALLVTVGLVGVYVTNLVRLVALAGVGYGWGVEALEQAHAQAGWVLFVAWALLFAWWARRRLHPESKGQPPKKGSPGPAATGSASNVIPAVPSEPSD